MNHGLATPESGSTPVTTRRASVRGQALKKTDSGFTPESTTPGSVKSEDLTDGTDESKLCVEIPQRRSQSQHIRPKMEDNEDVKKQDFAMDIEEEEEDDKPLKIDLDSKSAGKRKSKSSEFLFSCLAQ